MESNVPHGDGASSSRPRTEAVSTVKKEASGETVERKPLVRSSDSTKEPASAAAVNGEHNSTVRQDSHRPSKEAADTSSKPSGTTEELKKKKRSRRRHDSESEMCQVCGDWRDEENMLLCDECDLGFHTGCLKPPLLSIPEGQWYCPFCVIERTKRPSAPAKRKRNSRKRVKVEGDPASVVDGKSVEKSGGESPKQRDRPNGESSYLKMAGAGGAASAEQPIKLKKTRKHKAGATTAVQAVEGDVKAEKPIAPRQPKVNPEANGTMTGDATVDGSNPKKPRKPRQPRDKQGASEADVQHGKPKKTKEFVLSQPTIPSKSEAFPSIPQIAFSVLATKPAEGIIPTAPQAQSAKGKKPTSSSTSMVPAPLTRVPVDTKKNLKRNFSPKQPKQPKDVKSSSSAGAARAVPRQEAKQQKQAPSSMMVEARHGRFPQQMLPSAPLPPLPPMQMSFLSVSNPALAGLLAVAAASNAGMRDH